MTDEVKNAVQIIREACASVTANLATHQTIQTAIATVETALTARIAQTPTEPAKVAQNAK